jgi:hypothetical protein
MTVIEPELITIIEGPTPEFLPSPQRWIQSIHEGPDDRAIAMCQLRTLNGEAILERCQRAWQERRPVRLDYPDELRMRQQADVVAMRLQQLEEGPVLLLWVSLPIEFEEDEDDEGAEFDEDDDGFNYL